MYKQITTKINNRTIIQLELKYIKMTGTWYWKIV